MSIGKTTFTDWRCTDCNLTVATTTYNKRNNDTIMKEKKKFCKNCRAHKVTKRKDTSKGSLGNKR
jgi:ribosomal protein L33